MEKVIEIANLTKEYKEKKAVDDLSFTVNDGERICLMVIAAHSHVDWEPVETLDDTERGAGGFGHTGKE